MIIMTHIKAMAIATLLLFGVSGANAQSLGDYARSVRKNKPDTTSASRHFDNDNLPVNDTLSVVGPASSNDANAGQNGNSGSAQATKPADLDPAAAAAERQKTTDDWKQKIDKQKVKIDALNHELDLDQREYRLRAATYYADAGARLRDPGQWDKDEAQYKSDIEGKQKAIEAARQELDDIQEQARKAGLTEKQRSIDDNSNNKDNK